MYPCTYAKSAPERAAVVMGDTGEVVTYRELDERSNQLAHLLRAEGDDAGLAIAMENNAAYLPIAWGARRCGRYFTTVNHHLTPAEMAYIIDDCGARVLVMSHAQAETAAALTSALVPRVTRRLMVGGVIDGWEPYEAAVAEHPTTPVPDETEGELLQYSSGTTGRPKGIKRALTGQPISLAADKVVPFLNALRFREGGVYLSPAPLYHTAPICWTMAVQRMGGTVVVMPRFDAAEALRLIERYRVTHSQLVPTMFVRMLKLPAEERARHDLSSLERVIHAAAPCPVEIKRSMIEWWGPMIDEYYSSSEGAGATYITAEEWLAHPGSVGRVVLGEMRVMGPDGQEAAPGVVGEIWMRPPADRTTYRYIGAEPVARDGWESLGDVGWFDEDGYLYLADRQTDMILVGGANVYPAEVEAALDEHPAVLSSCVIGLPDEDYGNVVHAIVETRHEVSDEELRAHLASRLVSYKLPRTFERSPEPLRDDAGKVRRSALRAARLPTTP
jgi:fatty-acyl-CoA synthase